MADLAIRKATGFRISTPVAIATIVVLVGIGVAVIVWMVTRPSAAALQANDRVFIDVESGKTFTHTMEIGEIEPLESPYTHHRSGWRAEACYWTKDGKAKKNPTWVVELRRMGKEGKTYCPDCGREVVVHNPKPPKELMDAAQ